MRSVESYLVSAILVLVVIVVMGAVLLSGDDVSTPPASSPLATITYRYILRVNGHEYECQNFEFGGDNKSNVWLHDCRDYPETIHLENYTEFTVLHGPGGE